MANSFAAGQDHYVLLSNYRPMGISMENAHHVAVHVPEGHDRVIRDWCIGRLKLNLSALDYAPIPEGRYWRIAWEKDLKGPMTAVLGFDPLVEGGFISR